MGFCERQQFGCCGHQPFHGHWTCLTRFQNYQKPWGNHSLLFKKKNNVKYILKCDEIMEYYKDILKISRHVTYIFITNYKHLIYISINILFISISCSLYIFYIGSKKMKVISLNQLWHYFEQVLNDLSIFWIFIVWHMCGSSNKE
jgi:hypothetical protein